MMLNQKLSTQINPRPEIELLLCCSRTYLDVNTANRIQILLRKNIDWTYLIQIANFNNVMQLLYWNLKTYSEVVHEPFLSQLHNFYESNLQRNLFLTKTLLQILKLFETYHVSIIPFKGPVLATSAYGNLGLRQFNDLDILVQPPDFSKARQILISEGYKNIQNLTSEQELSELQSRYVKAYTYIHNDTGVEVELHWKLRATYSFFPLNHKQLWQCMVPLFLDETRIFTLSPEYNLLYLSSHGFGDRWIKLSLICDIAALLYSFPNINWMWVIEEAKLLNCTKKLFLAVLMAKNLLGTEIPEKIWQEIQADTSIKSLAEYVYQRIGLCGKIKGRMNLINQAIFDLKGLERLQDRIQYCVDKSFVLISKKYQLGFAKNHELV